MRAAGVAVQALVCAIIPAAAFAAGPLFPTPLHITRQVSDAVSGKSVILNEYAYGNRLISVRGARTSIADYEKGELIEIDRQAGTYSITRFEDLAKAMQALGGRAPAGNATRRHSLTAVGAKVTESGRTADFFEGESEGQNVRIGVDRSVLLSREGLEVLLGAAYPGVARAEHEIALAAASSPRGGGRALETTASGEPGYALPVEQVLRHVIDGHTLEFRSTVTRIGDEPPPQDLIAIPAGARLVVSRIVAVQRELEQLDNPAQIPRNP